MSWAASSRQLFRRQLRRVWLGAVIGVCAIAAGSEASASPSDIGIVITNSHYRDASIATVKYAEKDGEAVAATMEQVLGIKNVDPVRHDQTYGDMRSLFGDKGEPAKGTIYQRLRAANDKKARLFVYYSGHGAPRFLGGGVEPYLVTWDANLDNLDQTAYALKTLRENLIAIKRELLTDPEGQVILILESCFSGRTGENEPLRPGTSSEMSFTLVAPPAGIIEIDATQGNQPAFWDRISEHGMFTDLLLWGIHGDADKKPEFDSSGSGNGDGKVTLKELADYVNYRLPERLRDQRNGYNNAQQKAFFSGPDDFVIGRPALRKDMGAGNIATAEQNTCNYLQRDDNGLKREQNIAEINKFLNETCIRCEVGCSAQLRQRRSALEVQLGTCRSVESALRNETRWGLLLEMAERNQCPEYRPALLSRARTLQEEDAARACDDDQSRWNDAKKSGSSDEMRLALGGIRCPRVQKTAEEEFKEFQEHENLRKRVQVLKTPWRDCPDCVEMVTVPEGCFTMGANHEIDPGLPVQLLAGPPQLVRVTRPFAIGRTEVTVGQWHACAADGKCKVNSPSGAEANAPMTGMTFGDATTFAAWLREKTGKPYRLPSEAEWEYAAHAGGTGPFGKGIAASPAPHKGIGGDAHFKPSILEKPEPERPVRVGSFPANDFGLSDMHGNVAEFVADCYNPSHDGRPDDTSEPRTCTDPDLRIIKGGSFRDFLTSLHVSVRKKVLAGQRSDDTGFRVARDLEELPAPRPVVCEVARPHPTGPR